MRPHRTSPLWLSCTLLAGCLAPASPSEQAGADGGVAADAAIADAAESTASTPLHRLSARELENTLVDLLGAAYPGDWGELRRRIPDDPEVSGLDSLAQSLIASQSYVEQVHGLIGDLVAQLDLAQLDACDPAVTGEVACADQLLKGFGARALRRPLTVEERVDLLALFSAARALEDYPTALRAVVTRLLQSPQLLYHVALGDPVTGRLTNHEMASRLSYLLWETMPDDALFAAAARGELHEAAGVEAQLARLAADARGTRTLARFYGTWLHADELATISKDPEAYPEFDAVRASLREGLDRFVAEQIAGGTLSTLLTSNEAWVDAQLAPLYGVEAPAEGFAKVALDAQQRAGVLTHPGLLAVLGKNERSAPIQRGAFVLRYLACTPTPPPPPSAQIEPPPVTATTLRGQVDESTSGATCKGCHQVINPIGFGLGNFDGLGRWRDDDAGLPIDAAGTISLDGAAHSFSGPAQLGALLADSAQVRACVVKRWFRSRFGRVEAPEDTPILAAMTSGFATAGARLDALPALLARTPALYRPHLDLPKE